MPSKLFFAPSVSALASVALLATAPVATANDTAGAVIGGFVGGLVGSVVGQQQNGQRSSGSSSRSTQTVRTVAPADENLRRVQVNLNAMGCAAGSPDGRMGGRTRAGIRCFQRYVQRPETGTLAPDELAYVLTWRAEYGIPTYAALSRPALESPQPVNPTPNPLPDNRLVEETPTQEPPPGTGAIFRQLERPLTQAQFPDSDTTNTAGTLPTGLQLPALIVPEPTATTGACVYLQKSPQDRDSALAMERFCQVRAKVISETDQVLSAQPALNTDQLWSQCQGLDGFLAGYMAEVRTKEPAEYIVSLESALRGAGLTRESVSGYSVCIGIAFQRDAFEVSLPAALMLYAAGQRSYGELVASQVTFGFGTTQSRKLGAAWYEITAETLGTEPSLLDLPQYSTPSRLREIAARLGAEAEITQPETPQIEQIPVVFEGIRSLEPPHIVAQRAVEVESIMARKQFPEIQRALGLSREEILAYCKLAAESTLPVGEFNRMIEARVCRLTAYAEQDVNLISTFETILSESGDSHSKDMLLSVSQLRP